MKQVFIALLALACTLAAAQRSADAVPDRRAQPGPVEPRLPLTETTFRILVFTRTMNFRHDSIETGVDTLAFLGAHAGYSLDWTEDPARFTTANLKQYAAVVFLNTTGDVLGPEQEAAFEAYIRGGGGYVGIHAAADTEYDWPFYKQLVGAYFKTHPAVQPAYVEIADEDYARAQRLRTTWRRTDEWYDYRDVPGPEYHILAELRSDSYEGSTMSGRHPIAWRREIDKGRAAYTGMGHTRESYAEPAFQRHIASLILWAAGQPDALFPANQGEPGAAATPAVSATGRT